MRIDEPSALVGRVKNGRVQDGVFDAKRFLGLQVVARMIDACVSVRALNTERRRCARGGLTILASSYLRSVSAAAARRRSISLT